MPGVDDAHAGAPERSTPRAGRRFCRMALAVFALLHAAALALYAIGAFGLFGSPSGPLAGVFLVPLGLPWVLMLDGAPEAALPWLGTLASLVNLGLIAALCRLAGRG